MNDNHDDNDEEFSQHLSNTIFEYKNYQYKFEYLYKNIKNKLFPDFSLRFGFFKDKDYFSLYSAFEVNIIFYFYDHLFDLELCDVNNQI